MTIFNDVVATEGDRKMKAYVSVPVGNGPHPALILLHEVYGVNESLKAVADDMASRGFYVVCPNMYWRHNEDASFRPQAPGEEMTPDLDRQRNEARALMFEKLDHASVPQDIQLVVDALRSSPAVNGKVGAMGFCLGAKVAYMSAVQGIVDAAVPFYPTPELHKVYDLEQARNTPSPMMFILGGSDPYVTAEEKQGMIDASAETVYFTPGLTRPVTVRNENGSRRVQTQYFSANGHAFGRKGGKDYDSAVADHAYNLAAAFLSATLHLKTDAMPSVPYRTPASPLYIPALKK